MIGRRRLALCAAISVAILVGVGSHGPVTSRAAPGTAPGVVATIPSTTGNCPCLRSTVTLSATATASAGRTITGVDFQISPAGAAEWSTVGTATDTPYTVTFSTLERENGVYDVRAVATDSAGETGTSAIARDRVIGNSATFVGLAEPEGFIRGTVALNAAVLPGGRRATRALFEAAPAGSEQWTTIAIVDSSAAPGVFATTWNTRELGDGPYDLRVRVVDGSDLPDERFVSKPVRDRIVDNTPPVSSLSVPAGTLSGEVALTATAADPGSGVGGVRFERAIAGTGSWVAIGARAQAPYTQTLDTRALPDGRYDLRVIATDRVANAAASALVEDVRVSNPGLVRPGALTIETVVAPARELKLLGAIAGSSQHETWALGRSRAAPAVGAGGERLTYTAPSDQVVLLRYTDGGGWQIADVLRDADGDAFEQAGGAAVIGQMTPSGEAWVALTQPGAGPGATEVALFHRVPGVRGGAFVRDAAASAQLRPVLLRGIGPLTTFRLAGTPAYGIVTAANQDARTISVPVAGGGPPVAIGARLDYGVLRDGAWTRRTASLPPSYTPETGASVTLTSADVTGPDAGWGTVATPTPASSGPLALARFNGGDWTYVERTGLDALDQTGPFRRDPPQVSPKAVRADADGAWINANVGSGEVIARYDAAAGDVTRSWCKQLPRVSAGCAAPLDADHPAEMPDVSFNTPNGRVALALAPPARKGFVHLFAFGDWTKVPAPGFSQSGASASFSSPGEGWLAGGEAFGRVTSSATPDPLAPWPQANRSPLTSVALPPGSNGATGQSGALAVGLEGTAQHYDAAAGWLVDPTPPRARRLVLRAVAFAGSGRAFAVGQRGIILRWDGAAWTEDEQSVKLTQSDLNSVAFRPDGTGWAVGRFGTILRFDGSTWKREGVPNPLEGPNLTSVTIAGADVFAVDDGRLIKRGPGGAWAFVGASELPAGFPAADRDLRLVSGLPNGGIVAAGLSVVIVRQPGASRFEHAAQPVEGIAVALQAFQDGGAVRAFVSVAPPARSPGLPAARDVAGFPPGDGNLLRQTDAGWEDLSRSQFPGSSLSDVPADGVVKPPPVLAVASDPAGQHAWVVGGYAGTASAAGLGTFQILPARQRGWQTSQIWRYDTAGSVPSPSLRPTTEPVPASANTVTFAFFSSAMCKVQCSSTRGAQPDVNVSGAARQIAAFARQPGGPSFAVLGGNARGPISNEASARGDGAADFSRLPGLLSPLGALPVFAAFGPRDPVGTTDPARPWADAFARSRAPFGPEPPGATIAPVSSGSPVGAVNRYYAFDARQNGGRLRAIVLNNSAGPLDLAAPGQTAWLTGQLAAAKAAGRPVVVFLGRALDNAAVSDQQLGSVLAEGNVLAVFAGGELNERRVTASGTPVWVGASMGYQQARNNGVLWYSVAIDTATRRLTFKANPVIESLALKPLAGLSAARSSTLAFEAVGKRPEGSLATFTSADTFPGFDSYVGIPATGCGPNCIAPTYRFSSSRPAIGDFVEPSGPGSRFPKLDEEGHPILSAASGLFCGFNPGATTVSISTGLLRSSLPVTVRAGGASPPCGTVPPPVEPAPGAPKITEQPPTNPQTAPPVAPPSVDPSINIPVSILPPVPLTPQRETAPPKLPQRAELLPPPPGFIAFSPGLPVIAVPPLPGATTPVPPGGSASAQAAARRKEKAQKEASQSAYTTRPTDTPAAEWFYYPAVGAVSVLALLLIAGGMQPGPRPRPGLLSLNAAAAREQARRSRR